MARTYVVEATWPPAGAPLTAHHDTSGRRVNGHRGTDVTVREIHGKVQHYIGLCAARERKPLDAGTTSARRLNLDAVVERQREVARRGDWACLSNGTS
jgi:hypothetical protein